MPAEKRKRQMEARGKEILGLPPSTTRQEVVELLVKALKSDTSNKFASDHTACVQLAEVWLNHPDEKDIYDLCVNRTPHYSEVFSPALSKNNKRVKTEWPEDFIDPTLTEEDIKGGWVVDPITKCRFQGGVDRAQLQDAARNARSANPTWVVSLPERAQDASASAECSVEA